LSQRDRLAQLVMVGLDPIDEVAANRVVTVDRVGAVFIGGNATHLLTGGRLEALRTKSVLPLLTAVDEEGGRVQRIDALDGSIPSPRELAATMSPQQVTELAQQRGEQLLARSVVMDLAPVVDVSDAAANTVIGDRSFSRDPSTVSTYAGAYADGLLRAGVIPVLKHFPGHGRATGDSHRGLVRTPPLAALEADDLRPYTILLSRGEPVVMLGHLDVPGLTDGVPASLSPAAYRLLREKYRFNGVAMTDDLGAMRAVTDEYSLPDAVAKAIAAGADLALWTSPAPAGPVLDRLERGVRAGELTEDRVRDAVTHVLRLKTGCH
jgi:beta-N-acetylhexosaminidase